MSPWTLLPTLVVRSAGFGWQLVDGLRHARSAELVDRLCAQLDRAETVRAALPPQVRLTRGQAARLRNHRPLPEAAPGVPAQWQQQWDAVAGAVETLQAQWADAQAADEREAAQALADLAADPRILDAVVCSGPGVFRDLASAGSLNGRLRRQLASYVQRLATKCETMSVFGPINYGQVDPGLDANAVLAWKGPAVCPQRRAYLSAWAFDSLLRTALTATGEHGADGAGGADGADGAGGADGAARPLIDAVVPRRTTFVRSPRGEGATARLVRQVDGARPLADLAFAAGLTPQQARQALGDAVRSGLLSHDLIPPAVHPDPTRWLADRLASRSVDAGPAHRQVASVVTLLDAYPGAEPAAKLQLQTAVRRSVGADEGPAPAGPAPAGPASGAGKFYNDRVVVTEAAAGTLELTVGGGLARDLQVAVPAALDLLAEAATRTRRHAGEQLARLLGPGRFPLLQVLRGHGEVPVPVDPWLPTALADLVAGAPPDTDDLDLAAVLPAPGPGDLPVLCSADVMVVADDLDGYQAGTTPLVVSDVHDAALLTPWALQFHPDGSQLLAERDRQIEQVLPPWRALGVVARRSTGLPPLRFPGPVVELGTVDGPAERIPLDRLLVHSDGERVRLRAAGDDRDLVLHNGELDSFVHTALALPRVRPLPAPDLDRVPRLRYGNVVLSRRRWRLHPGPLTGSPTGSGGGSGGGSGRPPRTAEERLALRRALRAGGVPDRFFAKASHQRKPLYVDLDSPSLVEALYRLVDGAERLHAVEVLPDGSHLWLRDGPVGVAAELRCVYLRRPGPEGS